MQSILYRIGPPCLIGVVCIFFSISEALAGPGRDIALNVAGASTPSAPSAGFDPMTADDAALAQYGYPPRPDAETSPAAYARWAKAMRAIRTRIIPQLTMTNIRHRPFMGAPALGPATLAAASGPAYSSNWSGFVSASRLGALRAANFLDVVSAEYVVPLVTNATCDRGWDYASQWVGLDGWASNDVLQAGAETDAYCSSFHARAAYSVWFEWYPAYETRIANMTITAGDDLFVAVWAVSATKGKIFIENLNQGAMTAVTFTAPPGTTLLGESAEWIVERPEVGGKLATLAKYTADYFSAAAARDLQDQIVAPGAEEIDMTNGVAIISAPTLIGANAILFDYR
jgi:hypothetical protein